VSDIIDFLEKMGAEAPLRSASGIELAAALTEAGLESALLTDILTLDPRGLESLVGACSNVCCLVYTPNEKENEEKEQDEEDEGEDEDGEEEKEETVKKSQDNRVRRIA
jgi:hypothetical protein